MTASPLLPGHPETRHTPRDTRRHEVWQSGPVELHRVLHQLADHDRIGVRYGHATQAQALPRTCICRDQLQPSEVSGTENTRAAD